MEDGDILELSPQSAKVVGKINAGNVYIDGLSVGDVGNVVLHDRRMLSRDGIAVVVIAVNKETGHLVGRPEIVSRGFVDTREAREMIEQSRDYLAKALDHEKQLTDWGMVTNTVKDSLSNFYYEKTRRRPIIIPVLVKV
jgi:ribonuclease J